MFRKITAILLCLSLAAISAGCGDSKDSSSSSSSKAESSATESVTDAPTEREIIDDDIDGESSQSGNAQADSSNDPTPPNADSSNNAALPSLSTEEVTEILLDGEWKSGYITDAQGMIYTIKDYCEAAVADPKAFDMEMDFDDDGTVELSSADGEETGKYTVDGINVTLTDDTDGSELTLLYDTENDMLFMDLLGTGQILIGFTIE